MCMNGDILDSRILENYETNMFFTFFYVDIRSKLVSCMNLYDEQLRTCEEQYKHLRIS